MSNKIIFEQIESAQNQILSDCELQSFSFRSDSAEKYPILYRDAQVGTDVSSAEKSCGPSILKVNVGTNYEFQKLNATQIHRAIHDPKLHEFLYRIFPILKEEIDDSNLFNNL